MEASKTVKNYFTTQLLDWHENDNDRSLPWKSESDPYKIWLSEIILQQTRALQGLPYYTRFTETYPTIGNLASAPDEEVFRIWQGLGYYNRCKNMLATARYIANELGGIFPNNYDGIVALKGIGPYTAAAIASFAFGLPHAVVDGNVYRVLSRYFGIDTPIDTTEGKNTFATLAQVLLPEGQSQGYNQAIMDLGATVCAPRNPHCHQCPLQKYCLGFKQGLTGLLPVKSKKLVVTTRYFHYIVLKWNNHLWLQKRTERDIWENLHEPFLIEHSSTLDRQALLTNQQFIDCGFPAKSIEFAGKGTQRLTHRIIQSTFFTVDFQEKPDCTMRDGAWIPVSELKNLAFPKTVLSFLRNNLYF